MNYLSMLNKNQYDAVTSKEKHIIVIAGAGSGKTRVLTTRIALLIEQGINPEEILALTFTNKASDEMKERVEAMTNINRRKINVFTFHSFAVRILRREIEKLNLGFTKNFKIYDEEDTKKIMTSILEDKGIDAKEVRFYLEKRKKANRGDLNLSGVDKLIVEEFNQIACKENFLTFDDLIIYLIKILNVPEILKIYQQSFKYILVDEFQDTNPTQYEIIKKLQELNQNLFVVGDDFQCIYSFNESNPKLIFEFQNDFPDARIIKLEENYRSTPEILNLANHIIKNNKNQLPKEMFTKNSKGLTPVVFRSEYYQEENRRIITLIMQLYQRGVPYREMAILYRINSLSRTFEEELIKNRIPYVIYNGTAFYSREEVKDVLSYLRVIADDYDNSAFRRIINKPRRKIGDKTLINLENDAFNHQGEHYSLIVESENLNSANELFQKLMIAKGMYLNNKLKSIKDLIDYIMNDLNYIDYVNTLNQSSSNDRFKNIEELKNIVDEFEKANDDNAFDTKLDYLNYFLQQIALYSNTEETKRDAVKLMTLHSSKGLEFDAVFLPAMEENVFPSPRATTASELEEERRLYYVGITRAKKYLFITASNRRMLNGRLMFEYPSRFLFESKDKTIQKNA